MDLHEIYEGNSPGKPVFELSKSDKEHKLNMFQLVIQLRFIDGSLSKKFLSPAFNLRSLETKPGPKSGKKVNCKRCSRCIVRNHIEFSIYKIQQNNFEENSELYVYNKTKAVGISSRVY